MIGIKLPFVQSRIALIQINEQMSSIKPSIAFGLITMLL